MTNENKIILIVDDEPEYRTLIYKKLKAAGHRILSAQNGEEALVALWENHNIDLVLLDVRLPFINGLNITEIIRKDFQDKKIIICSALQKEEQQFLIENVEDYYCKNDDMDILLEKVNKFLNIKSRIGTLGENEKRISRRVPVNVLASCEGVKHLLSPSLFHFFSYTKDLSLRGGRFIIAEDMAVGQHFSAALELPANFLPLLIDCEVMWVRKMDDFDSKNKKNKEIGVRFVKLDMPQDEEKLKNYLSFA